MSDPYLTKDGCECDYCAHIRQKVNAQREAKRKPKPEVKLRWLEPTRYPGNVDEPYEIERCPWNVATYVEFDGKDEKVSNRQCSLPDGHEGEHK